MPMLLVRQREGHPACKNWVVRYWCGYLSRARCKCSSWCQCHPIICCSSKIQNGLSSWCRLTKVVLEKRPLYGCCVVSTKFVEEIYFSSTWSRLDQPLAFYRTSWWHASRMYWACQWSHPQPVGGHQQLPADSHTAVLSTRPAQSLHLLHSHWEMSSLYTARHSTVLYFECLIISSANQQSWSFIQKTWVSQYQKISITDDLADLETVKVTASRKSRSQQAICLKTR